MARFERTLDPRALWPEVGEDSFAAGMREVVRATSILLASPGGRARLVWPAGEAAVLGAAAFASGLGPLLGHWVEAGRLDASPVIAAGLRDHLDHGRRRAARLRGKLEELVRLFRRAGIDVTVLKGLHTGWEYFPEPGTRPATDIDLLLPTGAAADAARLLRGEGFTPREPAPGRSTWAPPGTTRVQSVRVTHADNPWTLDLHETLDRQFTAAASPARFGELSDADRRSWTIDGLSVPVLSQPLLACFLAVHASNHFPHLPPLRLAELVLVFQRDGGPDFPWEPLSDRFERTGTGAFAYPTLRLAEELVPGTVNPELLERLAAGAPRPVRRLLARVTPATAFQLYHRSIEGRFLWAGTGWRRALKVVTWLWPQDGRGARVPLSQALAVSGLRLRHLLGGRYRRRVR